MKISSGEEYSKEFSLPHKFIEASILLLASVLEQASFFMGD